MSILRPQQSNPNQDALFDRLKNIVKSEIHVALIGTITKYNVEKQIVSVRLSNKQTIQTYSGNATFKPAVIHNVPLIQTCGVDGGLTVPVTTKDSVLIVVLDRAFDNWLIGQDPYTPNTANMHHLNDSIAIPFIHPFTRTIIGANNTSTNLNYKETVINLATKIVIKNASQSFATIVNEFLDEAKSINAQLKATADALKSAMTATATIPPPAGAQAIGAPFPPYIAPPFSMDAATKANAEAVKTQCDTIDSNIDTTKNKFNELFDA